MDTNRGGFRTVEQWAIGLSDTFTRPTDTTPYTIGDVIAATVSTTATTALRSLTLGRAVGKPFTLRYLSLATNKTDFLPTVRVHLYSVSNPAASPNSGTALVGDNVAMVQSYNNVSVRRGHIDLPAMVLGHAAGDDYTYASRDEMDFLFAPASDDTKLYYRLEIVAGSSITPSSGQSFTLRARASE